MGFAQMQLPSDLPTVGVAGACNLIPIRSRTSVRAYVVVSAEYYAWASQYRWHVKRDGYAYRNLSHRTEGRGSVALHRELMGLRRGDGRQTDHKNRRKLDCRRENLRVVEEDGHNKQNIPGKAYGLSRFRGVSYHRPADKWQGRATVGGREHSAGYWDTEEDAAEAAAELRARLMPFALD